MRPVKARKVMGIHACMEVLKARPKKIRTLYVQKNWKNHHQLKWIVNQARRLQIDFLEQTQQQMSSWGQGHQGAALIVLDSPQLSLSRKGVSVLIYIDGLEDPRNLGAVLRASWLMGVKGVFLPARKSIREVTGAAAKIASGGAEYVPVEFLSRPYEWLKNIKKKNYWLYGLDPKGKHSVFQESFCDKTVLAVGSESQGLKNKTKSLCDRLIYIPQKSCQGSYNLSTAAAIGLGQVLCKKINYW